MSAASTNGSRLTSAYLRAAKTSRKFAPTGFGILWAPVVFWKCGTPPPSDRGDCTARDYFVGNAAGIFGEKSEHPSPKLIDTMEHIVQIATPHPAIVCDPFMGSGTTGVSLRPHGPPLHRHRERAKVLRYRRQANRGRVEPIPALGAEATHPGELAAVTLATLLRDARRDCRHVDARPQAFQTNPAAPACPWNRRSGDNDPLLQRN